jgi:hypothetical protein
VTPSPDLFAFLNSEGAIWSPAVSTVRAAPHDRRVFLEAIVYIRKRLSPKELVTIFRSSAGL